MKDLIYRNAIFIMKSFFSRLFSTEFKSSNVSTTDKSNSQSGSWARVSILCLFYRRSQISVSKKIVLRWNSVKKILWIPFCSNLSAEVINNITNNIFYPELQSLLNISVKKSVFSKCLTLFCKWKRCQTARFTTRGFLCCTRCWKRLIRPFWWPWRPLGCFRWPWSLMKFLGSWRWPWSLIRPVESCL